MERIVELKSGLAIDRLKGEGGKWSPLSIKMHGDVVGWLTTFDGVPTLIVSPNRRAEMAPVPDRGYMGVWLQQVHD
jgi:hypothetical protein